ncbi:hypothetical protein PSH61_19610 [Pseudomonas rhodesiae]|uniref:hypothetical protein n=1 Tax=Pseudomonas TaxID=286 RepID=UPI0027331BCD|nr:MULTISPECIES: hypothetical protein [Pseudomonas]MEA1031585.1 hypothetical protein [Pseudomonas sp. N-137]WLI28013.1 hypothetical protein PSH61_19610 [Pseudomonas rhodesiae]
MNFKQKEPVFRICSRFFQPEYDAIDEVSGAPIYTIYAVPQRYNERLEAQSLGLQRFAVIWDGDYDYRIFEVIERALVAELLSPISMLHLGENKITIVGTFPAVANSAALEKIYDERWQEAATTQWQSWDVVRVDPTTLNTLEANNPILLYGLQILDAERFGVFHYDLIMFAFDDTISDDPFP